MLPTFPAQPEVEPRSCTTGNLRHRDLMKGQLPVRKKQSKLESWGGVGEEEDRQRTAPHHTGEPSNLTCSMGRRGQTQLARMPGKSLSWLEAFLCPPPTPPRREQSRGTYPTPILGRTENPEWRESSLPTPLGTSGHPDHCRHHRRQLSSPSLSAGSWQPTLPHLRQSQEKQ